MFSQAVKLVLNKNVVQAIPTYARSCLPAYIITHNSMVLQFFQGGSEENKKLYWKSWNDFCKPTIQGRMAFHYFECFNFALLSKQCWCIMLSPSSLMVQYLQAKYYHNSNFLASSLGGRLSYFWCSLLEGHNLLSLGLRR